MHLKTLLKTFRRFLAWSTEEYAEFTELPLQQVEHTQALFQEKDTAHIKKKLVSLFFNDLSLQKKDLEVLEELIVAYKEN